MLPNEVDTKNIRKILTSYPLCRYAWMQHSNGTIKAACAITTLLIDAGIGVDFLKRMPTNSTLCKVAEAVFPQFYNIPSNMIPNIISVFDGGPYSPYNVVTQSDTDAAVDRLIDLFEKYNANLREAKKQELFLKLTRNPERAVVEHAVKMTTGSASSTVPASVLNTAYSTAFSNLIKPNG